MAELTEARKLNMDIGRRVVHFRLVGQFLGFPGSSGPAQITCGIRITDEMSKVWMKEESSWSCVEGLCLLGWDLMETRLRQRLRLDEMAE